MSRATRSVRVRLGRAAAALLLLLAALAARDPISALFDHRYANLVTVGAVLVTAGMGFIVIHDGLALLFRDLDRQASVVLRNLSSWGLYGLLALWIVSEFGINLSGLLVGGAILGVVLASAAQASLGKFFSGLVLMVVRPYQVGATIRLRSSIAGTTEYEGTVQDMHALYTTLRTANSELLHLPNSAVAASALVVGRAPLQMEMEATIPAHTPLGELRQRIERELGDRHATVSLLPLKLEASDRGPSLTCQVEGSFITEGRTRGPRRGRGLRAG